jgi:hypothetical protein
MDVNDFLIGKSPFSLMVPFEKLASPKGRMQNSNGQLQILKRRALPPAVYILRFSFFNGN